MITNERQYKITKARIREFLEALSRLAKLPKSKDQPWLREAQKDSVKEQIEQLQDQIGEYEKLKAGKSEIPDPVTAVAQTPVLLIKWRIRRGWDQEELAQRLGMAKQQIQRYEQNYYAQATLSVVSRVAAVLTGLPDPGTSTGGPTKANEKTQQRVLALGAGKKTRVTKRPKSKVPARKAAARRRKPASK